MALSVMSLYWAFASQLLDTGRAGHTITVTVSRCACWLRCSAYQVVASSNALELVDNKSPCGTSPTQRCFIATV